MSDEVNYEIRVVTLMGKLMEKRADIERLTPELVELQALLQATVMLLTDIKPDATDPSRDAIILEDLLSLTVRSINEFLEATVTPGPAGHRLDAMMQATLWLWQLNTALRVRRADREVYMPPPRAPPFGTSKSAPSIKIGLEDFDAYMLELIGRFKQKCIDRWGALKAGEGRMSPEQWKELLNGFARSGSIDRRPDGQLYAPTGNT